MDNRRNLISKTFVALATSIVTLCVGTLVAIAADSDYKLLAPIPQFGEVYKTGQIGEYVNAIIKLAIVISAVLAVVMITIGGFKYMTSESMGLKEEGKKNIQNAFLGIIILSASYLILNTINPALLNFDLNIRPVEVQGNQNKAPVDTSAPTLTQGEQAALEKSGRKTLGESLNLGAFPLNERASKRDAYRKTCEAPVSEGGSGGEFVSFGGGNEARCYSK